MYQVNTTIAHGAMPHEPSLRYAQKLAEKAAQRGCEIEWIRGMQGYDIAHDQKLFRSDVCFKLPNGSLTQMGIRHGLNSEDEPVFASTRCFSAKLNSIIKKSGN